MSSGPAERQRKRSRSPDPKQDEVEKANRQAARHDDWEDVELGPGLPVLTDEERIAEARSELGEHIDIGNNRGPPFKVAFFIEIAPTSSRRGSSCRFPTCVKRIPENCYRVAVYPGMYNDFGSADFYHVSCLEKLVDFSRAGYLNRVIPMTWDVHRSRGVGGMSIADGNSILDGGAKRLILKWKTSMGRLMDKRDGKPMRPITHDAGDLLNKAGSAPHNLNQSDDISDIQSLDISQFFAPVENDVPNNQEKWNLFEKYLPLRFEDLEDLKDPRSLSAMLGAWEIDKILARTKEDRLPDKYKKRRNEMSEYSIEAIRWLSSTVRPNF